MKRKIYKSLALLGVLLFSYNCAKKKLHLTGKETADEAFAQCLKLSTKKHFQEAIDCLEIFKSRYSDSKLALEAELQVAESYFSKKEYLLASETYQLYAKLHPNSEKLDYVYYRMGLCDFLSTPKAIDRDQGHLPEAIENLAIVFKQYPDSPYAKLAKTKYDDAKRLIAKRHFYIGRFYFKRGEYKAAVTRFREVYTNFADLGLDESALYYTVVSLHKLKRDSEAAEPIEILKTKFPASAKTKKAVQMVEKK